jgi:hypothetical protein
MICEVHLLHQSQPIVFEAVRNTYQKGDFFCVLELDGTVSKFPIVHIFRVKERAA